MTITPRPEPLIKQHTLGAKKAIDDVAEVFRRLPIEPSDFSLPAYIFEKGKKKNKKKEHSLIVENSMNTVEHDDRTTINKETKSLESVGALSSDLEGFGVVAVRTTRVLMQHGGSGKERKKMDNEERITEMINDDYENVITRLIAEDDENLITRMIGHDDENLIKRMIGDDVENLITRMIANDDEDVIAKKIGDDVENLITRMIANDDEGVIVKKIGDDVENLITGMIANDDEDVIAKKIGDDVENLITRMIANDDEDVIAKKIGDDDGKGWNLRPRRPKRVVERKKAESEKAEMVVRGTESRKEEKNVKPSAKFCLSLSREEIMTDLIAFRASRPCKKPKKRPRSVQNKLNMMFPCSAFGFITPELYEVCEKRQRPKDD
ncbi:hypothetical protein Droror1_Dr00011346 [Drosera rotundifolia]